MPSSVRATTAATAIRQAAAQPPRTRRQTPQTASTLEPASSPSDEMGCFGKIAACLRAFLEAICSCFSGRTAQTERVTPPASSRTAQAEGAAPPASSPFTLAEKLAKGNAIIDEHLRENPGHTPDNRVAVFIMECRSTSVTICRKVNEGEISIDAYAKGELRALLSRIETNDATLTIQTFFLERTPDHHHMAYTQSDSSTLFSRDSNHNSHSTDRNLALTPQEFSSLLNIHIPNPTDRSRLIACLTAANAS